MARTTERPLSAVTDTVDTELQQPQSSITIQQSQHVEDRESAANDEEVQPASKGVTIQQASSASVVLGDQEAAGHNDQTQAVRETQPSLEAGDAEQAMCASTASADSEKIHRPTTVQSGEENNQAVNIDVTFADLMPIPKRKDV